ncbi:MAG: Hpt domain-containing protein [Chloroflexota bacterium]
MSHQKEINTTANQTARIKSTIGILDQAALNNLKLMVGGDDPKVMVDIIEAFEQDTTKLLSEMTEAIDRKDSEKLYIAAHSLKSISAYVGATQLSMLCSQLEDIRRSKDFVVAETHNATLQTECNEVLSALRQVVRLVS